MKIVIDPTVKFENKENLIKKIAKLAKLMGIKKRVKIVLTKKHDETGKHGYMYPINGKKNAYVIGVNQELNGKDLLETLAHELQHVKQYDCGDLKTTILKDKNGQTVGFKQTWKGEDHTKTPYWVRPWEIEARSVQSELGKKLA